MVDDVGFLIQIGANLRQYYNDIDAATSRVVSHFSVLSAKQRQHVANTKKSLSEELIASTNRYNRETRELDRQQELRLQKAKSAYSSELAAWKSLNSERVADSRSAMQKLAYVEKRAALDVMEQATINYRIQIDQIKKKAAADEWASADRIAALTKEEFAFKRFQAELMRNSQKVMEAKKREHATTKRFLDQERVDLDSNYAHAVSSIRAETTMRKNALQERKAGEASIARELRSALSAEQERLSAINREYRDVSKARKEQLREINALLRENTREQERARKAESRAVVGAEEKVDRRRRAYERLNNTLRMTGTVATNLGRQLRGLAGSFMRLSRETQHFGRLGLDFMSMLGMQHSAVGRLITSLTALASAYFGVYGAVRLVSTAFDQFRKGAQTYNESMGRMVAMQKGNTAASAKDYVKSLNLSLRTPFTMEEVISSEIDALVRGATAGEDLSALSRMEKLPNKPYALEIIGGLAAAHRRPMQRAMFGVMDAAVENQWRTLRYVFSLPDETINRKLNTYYASPAGKKMMEETLAERWTGDVKKLTTAADRFKAIMVALADDFGGVMDILGKQLEARVNNLKAALQLLWGQIGTGAKILRDAYLTPEGKLALDAAGNEMGINAAGDRKSRRGFIDYMSEDISKAITFITERQGALGLLTDQFAKGGITVYHQVTDIVMRSVSSFKDGFMRMLGIASNGTDELYETVILPFIVSLEIWRRHTLNFWDNFKQGFASGWSAIKEMFRATTGTAENFLVAGGFLTPEQQKDIRTAAGFINTFVIKPINAALESMLGVDVQLKMLQNNQDVLAATAKALGLIASIVVSRGLLKVVMGLSTGVMGVFFKPLSFILSATIAIAGAAFSMAGSFIVALPAIGAIALKAGAMLAVFFAAVEVLSALYASGRLFFDMVAGGLTWLFTQKERITSWFSSVIWGVAADAYDAIQSVVSPKYRIAKEAIYFKYDNQDDRDRLMAAFNPFLAMSKRYRDHYEAMTNTPFEFNFREGWQGYKADGARWLGEALADGLTMGGDFMKEFAKRTGQLVKMTIEGSEIENFMGAFGDRLLKNAGLEDETARAQELFQKLYNGKENIKQAIDDSQLGGELVNAIKGLITSIDSHEERMKTSTNEVTRYMLRTNIQKEPSYGFETDLRWPDYSKY